MKINLLFNRNIIGLILAFIDIFIASIFVLQCSNPESNDNRISFQGKVTLEGETDYSDIRVAIYTPVELDTTLVQINEEYPNIGVHISQESEFNYREQEPLWITTTDSAGNWEINDVEDKLYNIVAEKDSFLTDVKYNMDSKSQIDLNLKKLIVLKNNDIVVSGSHYTVSANTEVNVQFGSNHIKNSTFLLNENSRVNIDVIPGDNSVENMHIINGENSQISILGSYEVNISLLNLNIKNYGAVTLDNFNYMELESVCLDNVEIFDIKNIRECHIRKLLSKRKSLIKIFNIDSMSFENSVVLGEDNLGFEFQTTTMEIVNNLFRDIPRAIFSGTDNYLQIRHNTFLKCEEAISLKNEMHGKITYNLFKNNSLDLRLHGAYGQPEPVIFNNNFINTKDFVITLYRVTRDISAENNYWDTTNILSIPDKIYDRNDNPQWGYVLFEPFLTSPDLISGIN